MELALAQNPTHHAPATPTPDVTYTRELHLWRAAHDGNYFHALVNAWLQNALLKSSIGREAQLSLRASLTTMTNTIKDISKETAHIPKPESWRIIQPAIVRGLAFEAAADIYLGGGLHIDFVNAAANALACEPLTTWSGFNSGIDRQVDAATHKLQANYKIHREHPKGCYAPHFDRRRGGDRRGQGRANNRSNTPNPNTKSSQPGRSGGQS